MHYKTQLDNAARTQFNVRSYLKALLTVFAAGWVAAAGAQDSVNHKNLLDRIKGQNIAILISSSMPKASLNNWAEEARQYALPLYLRGFIHNSLHQTSRFIQSHPGLSHAQVKLDPRPFTQCHIDRVPAVCWLSKPVRDRSQTVTYKVVYGDVGLSVALKQLFKGESIHETV